MHTLRHPCVLSRRCDFHDEAAGESNSFNGGSTQDEEQSSRCLKLASTFFKVFFFPPAVSSVMEWEQAEKSNLYFCLILLLFWLQIPWSHNLFVQFHKPSVLYKLSPFTRRSQSPWMLLPVSYHMCSVCQNSLLLCWYLTWFWIETTVVEFRPELLTAGSLCVILKCCSEN